MVGLHAMQKANSSLKHFVSTLVIGFKIIKKPFLPVCQCFSILFYA